MQVTNCHIHTFTHDHVPDRFVPFPLGLLLRVGWLRRALLAVVQHFDRGRRTRLARYAKILEVSYKHTQEDVFKTVQGFYPRGTRFVVLPMDMELMGAGKVKEPIDEQHAGLRELRDGYRDLVIPFAAADARRHDVVENTVRLLEQQGFRGIKLYPPTGYHPNDPALRPLYSYAAERGIPVMTHCSRPASVQYRGRPTERMLTDPVTGERLGLGRKELLTLFTDPDSYVPILEAHPTLKICLAHFGGAGDWKTYLERPWDATSDTGTKSWLAKILDMLRSGKYENLYTDISYTVFADEEYVHLLKVLLTDERVRRRVLFGSDFYVVEDAKLEERRISLRVRSVLGEDLFRMIAHDNPRAYLGENGAKRVEGERRDDAREELRSFLSELRELLATALTHEDWFPEERLEDLRAAWEEIQPRFTEAAADLEDVDADSLARAGLWGSQLVLKMKGWREAARGFLGHRTKAKLRAAFGWANTILKSLAGVVGAAEPISEIKDAIEAALDTAEAAAT